MNDAQLKELLWKIRDGRGDADEFYRATKDIWRKMVHYMLGRWRAPEWVMPDDLIQEMAFGAWRAIWKFDLSKSRGHSISEYVRWNAFDVAKKELHRMRSAIRHRNADDNESRYDIPFTVLFSDTPGEGMLGSVEPSQEDMIEAEWALKRARSVCLSEADRQLVDVLAETGDMSEGAARLGWTRVAVMERAERIAIRLMKTA